MRDRPFVLEGNICLKEECILGKIIKNRTVDSKDKCIQVLENDYIDQFEEGYSAYIFQDKLPTINLNGISYCSEIDEIDTLVDYDVVEIIYGQHIRVLYRSDSDDNAIVVTNQCNSNCIMCPDSNLIRKNKNNPCIDKLLELVECIPDDVRYLTITGGEAGLLKDDLVKLLSKCKECLPNTEFLLLTNGRVFANTEFTNKICDNLPRNIRIAIPIYAPNEELHDEITRVKGSFRQAVVGIKKLLSKCVDVEIRVVVQKKNYKCLEDIANFIKKNLKEVVIVNFMALEMLGNSYKNKEDVWVNFLEVKDYLYKACIKVISAGIQVNLYNFPLCNLDKRLYGLATQSITDYKVLYKEECQGCKAKGNCGGFFFSTINMKDIEVKPIE